MSSALPVLIALGLAALLAGCKSSPEHVADLPPACPAATPEVVVVERRVYVPVPRELTRREPVAEGPLSECPLVAAERRAALESANARLRQIEQLESTEVEP